MITIADVFESIKNLIKGPLPIPKEEAEWQVACFKWLLKGSGGFGRFRHSMLVLPTDDFFPQRGLSSGAFEVAIFEQIKRHAGMERWRCALEVQAMDPDPHVSPTVVVQGAPRSPLGTFHGHPSRATVTYYPGLISDPMSFIATMAHELGHFLISDIAEPLPGGAENLEFATDIAAVFLGFGIFLANAAFNFTQFDDGATIGWSTQRQGYLSEPQLLNALSIFATLLEIEPRQIAPHLKASLRHPYKAAYRAIARSEARVDVLRSVSPIEAHTREIDSRFWR